MQSGDWILTRGSLLQATIFEDTVMEWHYSPNAEFIWNAFSSFNQPRWSKMFDQKGNVCLYLMADQHLVKLLSCSWRTKGCWQVNCNTAFTLLWNIHPSHSYTRNHGNSVLYNRSPACFHNYSQWKSTWEPPQPTSSSSNRYMPVHHQPTEHHSLEAELPLCTIC